MLRRAVFLDRDGTINVDHGYIDDPDDFELLPDVPQALRMLQQDGWALVVVTNQSGIGRGMFTEDAYQRVTQRMREVLAGEGVHLQAVLHCPHTPEDACTCRKPLPGLILQGARQLGVSIGRSVMVGDKRSDLDTGVAAGCWHSILCDPGSLEVAAGYVVSIRLDANLTGRQRVRPRSHDDGTE